MTINLLKQSRRIVTYQNGEARVILTRPDGGLRVFRVRSYRARITEAGLPQGVLTFTPQSYTLGFKITRRMLDDDAKKAEAAIRAFASWP